MHTDKQSHPNTTTINGVRCEVSNCHYNEQKACAAKEIKVGPHFASSSCDTVCATFKPH